MKDPLSSHARRGCRRGDCCGAAGARRRRRSVRRLRRQRHARRGRHRDAAGQVTSTQSGLHLGARLSPRAHAEAASARASSSTTSTATLLLAVRALDYRRHVSERFALTAFAGAARLDLATPALRLLPRRRRAAQRAVAELESCASTFASATSSRATTCCRPIRKAARPDNFYDLSGVSVYLSRRF